MAERVVATPAGRRRRGDLTTLRERLLRLSPATLLLVAALLATGALLLALYSNLTFSLDEWSFLLHRRGFSVDVFLDPHNEHISILPVAIYKLLLAVFGMDSPLPFQVVAVVSFLTAVGLLFVLMRRFVGEWLALAATLPILVLGGGWEDLLLPFQIGYTLAIAFGLGALLMIARGDRLGDGVASLLLIGSVITSSVCLVFIAGVGAWMLIDRERRRRLWVVVVPAAIFALWWLGWGREAETQLSLQNVVTSPSFAFDGIAASLSNLLGLATPRDDAGVSPYDWGRPLLVLLAALVAWRLWRLGKVPGWLPVMAAILVSFWLLTAFNASVFRNASAARYQLPGAMFLLLVIGALLYGVRLRRRWLVVVFAIAVAAAASNLSFLHQAYEDLAPKTDNERAALASIELARGTVDPGFLLTSENGGAQYFDVVDAGSYLSAVDAFGSPAYDTDELAAAPEHARATADTASAAALEVGLRPLDPAEAQTTGDCDRVGLGQDPATVRLPPGGAVVETGADGGTEVRLRRYAVESFPVEVGALSADQAAVLDVPSDDSTVRWELELTGWGSARVCARR